MENDPYPITKITIETKGFQNFKEEGPINGIKSFLNFNFEGHITAIALFVQKVDSL